MPSKMLSAILVICFVVFGGIIGQYFYGNNYMVLLPALIGLIIGFICLRIVRIWLGMDIHRILGGATGILIGALLSLIASSILEHSLLQKELLLPIDIFLFILFCAIGMQVGASKGRDLKRTVELRSEVRRIIGILDTSVIIDGRIADVCETGFLDGDIIIPQFVLKELQTIADSPESTKRTRGRRGLDILNKIKKQTFVKIIIDDTDYPSIKDVDQKLITMAKETGYPILTNDFNLNKVAEVQSIQVLNINQLANSLKPIVLPGETMKVQILKEGKEHNQGVAYLDDGTMVVVDNGRKFIGKTVDVTVTSVLQTTAGRMIFAVLKT
ncbi:MAG: TRAM domain-containing protein [Candidatus Hadarchaeum sp.]